MSFWEKALGPVAPTPQQRPVQSAPRAQQRAWWQDPVEEWPEQAAPGQAYEPAEYHNEGGLSASDVKKLRKKRTNKATDNILTMEEAEQLAQWELDNIEKYHTECPECGSGNYLPAGSKMPGGRGIMPTEKCFDCGLSARGPEIQLGGHGGGASATVRTLESRQIDTGGAGGQSMYMMFRTTPSSYIPRT